MNIFITGAESTGKSELTEGLAEYYGLTYVPEYARDYIATLNREYTGQDVERIALKQIEQIRENQGRKIVFFDTGLIITQVWLEDKFNSSPPWIEQAINDLGVGFYLVCQPDIPWEEDPLRENSGRREELNRVYINKIEGNGFPYGLVDGFGEKRLEKAIGLIDDYLGKNPAK